MCLFYSYNQVCHAFLFFGSTSHSLILFKLHHTYNRSHTFISYHTLPTVSCDKINSLTKQPMFKKKTNRQSASGCMHAIDGLPLLMIRRRTTRSMQNNEKIMWSQYCISVDAIDVIADAIARVRATLLSLVGFSCNSVRINACTVAQCKRIQ